MSTRPYIQDPIDLGTPTNQPPADPPKNPDKPKPKKPNNPDPKKPDPPAKDPDPLGILQGGQTIRIKKDGKDFYYQMYEFPPGSGNYASYQFDTLEQAQQVLGKGFAFQERTNDWFKTQVMATAGVSEVVGQADRSWASYTDDIMHEAALRAGVRDPSLAGKLWSDPEMQNIAVQAIVGNWSPAQVLAAQRNTTFWKETLYPGIEHFYGSTSEPEGAWRSYVGNVSGALTDLGYAKDADGTFNSTIKKMLDKGINDQIFNTYAPVFLRAEANAHYAQALSARAQATLGKEVGFGEWFDLLAGEAPVELQRVANEAAIQYQAERQGFALAESNLDLLADHEVGENDAARAFSEVTEAVLALGTQGLRRGQLSRDEILAAAAGINPETGRSIEEVRLQVGKLAQEEGLFDDRKLNLYQQYTASGTAYKAGLQSFAPERA